MVLTKKQEEGLKIAVSRYKNNEKFTVIAGPAGSGKSSLIKFITESLPIDKDKDICYATYTGKAAQVLYKKGNKNVSTLHKLLYKSVPMPNGGFKRTPVGSIPYKVIIVDEVSMPPKEMMKLLFSYNVHVICCGDSAQLPPIDKNADNHLLDHPHIYLDEIMRQALESDIIKVSIDIRNGKQLKPFKGNDVLILNKNELNTGMLQWADQIICATNRTRHQINNTVRQLKKFNETHPVNGDKMICLRNYWDVNFGPEDPLINGTIGYLRNSFDSFIQLPYKYNNQKIDITVGDIAYDDNIIYKGVPMDQNMITKEQHTLDTKTSYLLHKDYKYRHLLPFDFTYGYAITGWKAQGSEWDKVLIFEEGHPYDKEEHKKYLYTCLTRASEKVVLLLNN